MAHQEVIEAFYTEFTRADGLAMAHHYADEAVFSDPVFPKLDSKGVQNMWKMLCGRAKDLHVTWSIDHVGADQCFVSWTASYTFNQTGRKVTNHVRSTLTLKNSKIVRHIDDFSFWTWSRQAFGPAAWLLGWTPFFQAKVQEGAAKSLARFSSDG